MSIILNAGAGGATLGTDKVAGIDYQKVKPAFSTDGVTPVSVDATNGLPSNVVQIAGTAVDTNSGVKSGGTLRVVLATDQPALTTAMPVSAASLPLPAGASTAAKQPALGTAGAASADVITIQGVASMTPVKVDGSGVTQPVSGTVTTTPPANASTNVAQVAGAAADTNSGVKSAGTLRVVLATDQPTLANGQPAIQSGMWTVQPGNTPNSTPWLVTDTPATVGGLSFNGFVGAATNNKTQIKASAGQLYLISVQNLAATPVYLKVFNNTSAGVTMGTTNCDFQFMIPGNTAGAGIVLNVDKGIALGTGITIALTAGIATNDNTATAANQQVVTIGYK